MRLKAVNKKIGIIVLVVALILGSIGVVRFFTKEDQNTTLTVIEKKWIEDNKNNVIDFATLNNTPIISDNGGGIFFDFINDLQSDTELEFNKVSYEEESEISAKYSLIKKDTLDKNDLLLYQDNYVLITSDNVHYTDISEIQNLKIGTLKNTSKVISEYLTGSLNLTYTEYNTAQELQTALQSKLVNAIALPKLNYLETILSEENMHIAYNISEYKINYIIKLGDNDRLNKIITKYLNKWQKDNFQESFNNALATNYFTFKEISEKNQTDLRSKRYTVGFVANAPYDITVGGTLKGFNHYIIDNFADIAGLEIDYKQYSSVENMLKDFEENKIDIVFNNFANKLPNTYQTIPIYDSMVAIITDNDTDLVVNNVTSLKGAEVLTVKNSKIAKYLKDNNIKTKEYDNIKDLINNINSTSIAAIDEYTYDYYVRLDLKNFKNLHTIDINNNYGYTIKKNKNLNEFFDFYLSFINVKEIINESYKDLLLSNNNNKNLQIILSSIAIVLLAVAGIITKIILSKKKDINSKLSKTDKLRYVDSLTSLKNRNYLNDNIEKWDNSEAYPQSIIIIDLNNIAYINDNFGHTEGDKVIVEAASILINHQLSNSEILRTNGNEFLIFIIGHDEKDIVTYIRKLNKEFKELSHGFGAATGYSMINDEIKTIDDAINEATLDMRNNKEEVKN